MAVGDMNDRILHAQFASDRRGLISELVRRLVEYEGCSDPEYLASASGGRRDLGRKSSSRGEQAVAVPRRATS